jgi:hypothetical protein
MSAKPAGFDEALIESVDEGVKALFSQQVVDALYLNLKNKRNIARADLPNQLPILRVVFAEYFGLGARTLERTIARRFYARLGIPFSGVQSYNLTDYVEHAAKQS